ncbi:hypothetical protein TNCV_1511431 [Trichonephila clavipes]|nr:hypothetical protein TNCV_1511431 [Trichonephila clavipes]
MIINTEKSAGDLQNPRFDRNKNKVKRDTIAFWRSDWPIHVANILAFRVIIDQLRRKWTNVVVHKQDPRTNCAPEKSNIGLSPRLLSKLRNAGELGLGRKASFLPVFLFSDRLQENPVIG